MSGNSGPSFFSFKNYLLYLIIGMVAIVAVATMDSPLDYAAKLFNSCLVGIGTEDVTLITPDNANYLVL